MEHSNGQLSSEMRPQMNTDKNTPKVSGMTIPSKSNSSDTGLPTQRCLMLGLIKELTHLLYILYIFPAVTIQELQVCAAQWIQ